MQRVQGFRAASSFLFTAFLITALLSYNLFLLTSFEMVEKIATGAFREVINIQSLTDAYYPELIKIADQNPDANLVVPGFGVDLGIKAADIKDVPRDEIGDFISYAVIKRIYYDGFSSVYRPSGMPDVGQDGLSGLVDFADAFINKRFNDLMFLIFRISTILAVCVALPFFVFSPGFKKLTGFGGSLIMVGLPGLFLTLVHDNLVSIMQSDRIAGIMIGENLLPFIKSVQVTYLTVLLSGVGLFLIGMSGIFITRGKNNP